MHMLIAFIVYANSEDEAFKLAYNLAEELVSKGIFDYCLSFKNNYAISRWGKIPPVLEANSKQGEKLIERLMDRTWNEFKANIQVIRKLLKNFTDEEIFEEEPTELKQIAANLTNEKDKFWTLRLNRVYFLDCARFIGCHSVFLFDHTGSPIANHRHLELVLSKWAELYEKEGKNPYADKQIFVVPFDAHY